MKLWLVEFAIDYEPGYTLGVFSSEEKAKEAVRLAMAAHLHSDGTYVTTDWELDKSADEYFRGDK